MADNCLPEDVNGGKIVPKRRTKQPRPRPSPAPWRRGNCGGTIVCDTHDECPPINAEQADCERFYGGHLIAESIGNSADLVLMLAAPDLLAACEAMLDSVTPCNVAMQAIRNAVAKAKGGAE